MKKFVVHFDTGASNCSGWLRAGSKDLLCFTHQLSEATVFKLYAEAAATVEEHKQKITERVKQLLGDGYESAASMYKPVVLQIFEEC